MLCVVIGIVPPLDDEKRIAFLRQNSKARMKNAEGGETRICWARDTRQKSWVVPDEDLDDAPTMLLSAYLFNCDDDNEDNGFGGVYGGNELRTNPGEFASFVEGLLDSKINYSCEVWASAPAPLPLITFGTGGGGDSSFEGQKPPESTAIQNSGIASRSEQSDFRQNGLCLLPNIFLSNNNDDGEGTLVLSEIRSMVDEAIHEAEDAITRNHSGIEIGEDAFLFREIASRSKHRFDLLIRKETQLYQLLWDRVRGTDISGLLRKLFSGSDHDNPEEVVAGVEWDMDLSVVYSKPGANHQGWHADGGHAEGASDAGWNGEDGLSSSLAAPYAVCLFVPLIDLDDTVGFTQFWPGSHRHKDLVGFGPFAEVAKATWDGIVSAGEAIVYDYRLLHRGMPNRSRSSDAAHTAAAATPPPPHPYRAVLQLLCRRTWYTEKNNYGTESIYRAAH